MPNAVADQEPGSERTLRLREVEVAGQRAADHDRRRDHRGDPVGMHVPQVVQGGRAGGNEHERHDERLWSTLHRQTARERQANGHQAPRVGGALGS